MFILKGTTTPDPKIKPNIILLTLFVCMHWHCVRCREETITLRQGIVVGLKVFVETSRVPVYAFLGIPYAEPPIGARRFAAPVKVAAVNRTIVARDYRPACLQPTNNYHEELLYAAINSAPRYRQNEDCLYLNVWTSKPSDQGGGGGGGSGSAPVLVFITGEEMAFDWTHHRPSGLDLAAEGLVVVTVQYRTNIFGWLAVGDTNFGLRDQQLALDWIQENIDAFGGDVKRVTLCGAGTAGAPLAMIHSMTNHAGARFRQAIFISGTIFSEYSFASRDMAKVPTDLIVRKLACESAAMNEQNVLACLRGKSVDDLMIAFELVYKESNYTVPLGPIVDDFLTEPGRQILPSDPRLDFDGRKLNVDAIMMGMCSNEGAFIRERWIELARQGTVPLRHYIDTEIIANIVEQLRYSDISRDQILDTIDWRFFDSRESPTVYLNAIMRLIGETRFEVPFYETLSRLMANTTNASAPRSEIPSPPPPPPIFVFTLQQDLGMDMRGKVNYFGGAPHSADLPLLMAPSLFQQISRRRQTPDEERLSKRMRQYVADFVKSGNPTPGRLFDGWQPFDMQRHFIKPIGDSQTLHTDLSPMVANELNRIAIDDMLQPSNTGGVPQHLDTVELATTDNPYHLFGGGRERSHATALVRARDHGAGAVPSHESGGQLFERLARVHAFWRHLLPQINRHALESMSKLSLNDFEVAGAGMLTVTAKYRHAFFSMLTLVCLLLIILGICVYILRKNRRQIDTSVL